MHKVNTIKNSYRTLLITGIAMAMVLASAVTAFAGKPSQGSTIVDTAIAVNADGPYAGSFDTLIAVVGELGLVDVLSGNRPYTVFAPTDDAFAVYNITTDANGNLINNSGLSEAELTNIVLYHVTNGKRLSQSVVNSSQLRMANGEFAAVNGASVDGANIIVADVKASNGVIHAVDAVLLP